MIETEADSVGEAILAASDYLSNINPHAIYEIYEIKQKRCLDIVLDDLILN